jgi:hypothetical protein
MSFESQRMSLFSQTSTWMHSLRAVGAFGLDSNQSPANSAIRSQEPAADQAPAAWQAALNQRLMRLQPVTVEGRLHRQADIDARFGELIWRHRADLRREKTLHFFLDSTLLGILDAGGHRLLARRAAIDALAHSQRPLNAIVALVRPSSASQHPRSQEFTAVSMYDLLWQYGQMNPNVHTHLPPQIATAALHLRRLPWVSQALLNERHERLVRLMGGGAKSFTQLAQHLGEDTAAMLFADVASLYVTGCLGLGSRPSAGHASSQTDTHQTGLTRLAYCSTATEALDDASFAQIVSQAHHNNAKHGISGLMMWHQRLIIQWIEGPAPELGRLWRNISLDPRHSSVVKLLHSHGHAQRLYGQWAMRPASLEEMREIVNEARVATEQHQPAPWASAITFLEALLSHEPTQAAALG